MGKSPIVKKNHGVNNYLISNTVFVPQMRRVFVSYATFKAHRLVKLFEAVVSPSKRMERQMTSLIVSQTSLHKSLSLQKEESRIAIKPTVP